MKTLVYQTVCNMDIIIVAISILLLLLNKGFRAWFRHVLPIAILYELLRFLSLSIHYETNFYFHTTIICLQWLLAFVFCGFNIRRVSAILTAVGSALNMIAVFSNHMEMPILLSVDTWGVLTGYSMMPHNVSAAWLCDWMYVPRMGMIFSFGDVAIMIGFLSVFVSYIRLTFYSKNG